jgi:serine phosphatase RsbU (regulator of sigma subunit)
MTTKTLFTDADLAQFAARGIDVESAAAQLEALKNPPPAIVLDRPCTLGDGIFRIEPEEQTSLIDRGDSAASSGRVTKFVPASGAATRMFKDLITALTDAKRPSASPAARELFEQLDSFPFAEEVRRRTRIENTPEEEGEERAVLETLLEEMGYAQRPKGLIPFHRTDKVRTAFEEQLLEGTRYARSADHRCRMHFTVAPEFRSEFETTLADLAPEIERKRRGCALEVGFSEQHPSTDTLAIDAHGEPFRLSDRSLLFRPGGHGALLHNLAATNGDIVAIKNIDNILPDEASGEVVRWKRILIGYLTQVQSQVFELLHTCAQDDVSEAAIDRAIAFAAFRFSRRPDGVLATREGKLQFVFDALDRPLRICGVVKNEGEPGGAPFWVVEPDGTRSVQIVESSQVDMKNAAQVRIFKSSTHFNPVDIVCGLRSWMGEPYDLGRFVDRSAVFMSKKTHEGRELIALERPGLWNGAMAHWNTICVEVPGSTFAPVKTVFDLLRPQHQYRPATVDGSAMAEVEGRVLVVEDDLVTQRALEQILLAGGLDVVVASEGERALEIVRAGDVDLILLDVVLPGHDGFEIMGRLRALPDAGEIPVVFIAPAHEEGDRSKRYEPAAVDYVTTPFNEHEVLSRVRAQLRIRQLAASLARANAQLVERQEVMAENLKVAADIQKTLLPQVSLDLPTLTSASLFQPSMQIAGDTFNFVKVGDSLVAGWLADVSGHGVASSLLAVSINQRLASAAGLLSDGADLSPANVMRQLDREYPFERYGKYFSLILVLIDVDTGVVRYSSAGHPPPFIARANGSVVRLEVGGPVIGMGFEIEFEEGEAQLEPGDRLVLYSDGVIEDESSNGERFGLEPLIALFQTDRAGRLSETCVRLIDLLAERRGDVPPSDDIALLAFQATNVFARSRRTD